MPEYTHHDLGLATEIILDAYKSPSGEFKGFIIEGKPRIGKTVYAIKTLRDVYLQLHPEPVADVINKTDALITEAYEWAIKQVHFELEPFLQRVGDKQREIRKMLPHIDWTQRIPGIVLDDSSLYAGTDLYFRDQSLYSSFSDTMTTIGSATAGILITCPHHQSLAKPIREFYNYYVVKIIKMDEWRREAKVMEWYESGKSRTLKLREYGVDEFTAHVPQAIYSKYLGPRLEKGEQAVTEALEASRARASTESTPTEIKGVAEEVLKPKRLSKAERRKKRIEERRANRLPELANAKILR